MKVKVSIKSAKIEDDDFKKLQSLLLSVWKRHKSKHPKITWQSLVDGYSTLPEVKDPEKRARWDLLWAAPRSERTSLIDKIYKYANDTHIDSALKGIVKALK